MILFLNSTEFNVYFDAEAAYIVLNEIGCPITITTAWTF